jgi:hypothetical protein
LLSGEDGGGGNCEVSWKERRISFRKKSNPDIKAMKKTQGTNHGGKNASIYSTTERPRKPYAPPDFAFYVACTCAISTQRATTPPIRDPNE